jgi:Ca2+-transporting ATPase
VIGLALKKFLQMNGSQSAAAFAHYAFFSLFPLIILFVAIASTFFDRARAGMEVIAYVETYIPISGEMQSYIFDTIFGVVKARGQASAVASVMLIWAGMQFFTTLICATNRAWNIENSNWWRLPLKSLVFLAIMVCVVLLGVALPVLTKMTNDWLFPMNDFITWPYVLGRSFIPTLVVFLSLSLFYRLAPNRLTSFSEVWVAALSATVLLQAAENLFVIYLNDFATLNAVYGAFGGIMALLLWIYLTGYIFLFGACLCAALAEGPERSQGASPVVDRGERNRV